MVRGWADAEEPWMRVNRRRRGLTMNYTYINAPPPPPGWGIVQGSTVFCSSVRCRRVPSPKALLWGFGGGEWAWLSLWFPTPGGEDGSPPSGSSCLQAFVSRDSDCSAGSSCPWTPSQTGALRKPCFPLLMPVGQQCCCRGNWARLACSQGLGTQEYWVGSWLDPGS